MTENLYFDAEPEPATPNTATPAPSQTHLAAQASARIKKTRAALPLDRLSVWSVRQSNLSFVWELRRYGAVVVRRGTEGYSTSAEARAAGEAVLASMADG